MTNSPSRSRFLISTAAVALLATLCLLLISPSAFSVSSLGGTSGAYTYDSSVKAQGDLQVHDARGTASPQFGGVRDGSVSPPAEPTANIARTVDARQGPRTVEVYLDAKLIKTHVRIERGRSTDNADYPPEKIAFMMKTPAWCRRQAAELGVAVAEVVAVLMEVNALYRLRQAQGVKQTTPWCKYYFAGHQLRCSLSTGHGREFALYIRAIRAGVLDSGRLLGIM